MFFIDYNIFEYIPKGIKIISEINEMSLGFNLFSNKNQKIINTNEIILINDILNFKKVYNSKIKLCKYSLEFIPIISEPDFDEFNSIFNLIKYFPTDNIELNPINDAKIFNGKKAYFSFTIQRCYNSCQKCIYYGNSNNHECQICSSEYPFFYNLRDEIDEGINCFKSCSENYISNNNYLCIEKNEKLVQCSKDFPFEITTNKTCSKDCSSINFFNKICKINYNSIESKDRIINNIKSEIKNGSLYSL